MAFVKAKKDKSVLVIESFKDVKSNFESYFFRANILALLLLIFSIFSPVFWFATFFLFVYMYNVMIWDKYFKNKILFNYYLDEFSCPMAEEGINVFTKFGYKIDYDNEWDSHYAKLKGYALPEDSLVSKKEVKNLASNLAKEANRVRRSQPYREVGIGKDLATRHILFIGTTGAGKTESMLTWFADILDVRNSGAIIMIDGKADSKIHSKLSSIIAEKNRVTSSCAINFLKQEKMSTTNTYNSILSMSPYKGVSFMGSLLPSSEGGDNGDYFKMRGIAMLTVPLASLKIRNEYFGEPFSLGLLQDSTSTLNISILFALFYGFVKEEDEHLKKLIETNKEVALLWREAKDKSTAVNPDVIYYEKILNYVTQYKPSAKTQVEKIIGFDFRLFHMSYNMVFKLARAYSSEIFAEWRSMADVVAEALYVYSTKIKNKSFSVKSKDFVSLEDIRRYFDDIGNEEILNNVIGKSSFDQKKIHMLRSALGLEQNAKATLYKLPDNAIQQHSYSQQQWTALFQTFDRFPHIFGSPFPDIDMKDVIKNNKTLYVFLPVLELGDEMSKLLGKMIIRDMQESGSVSLGGEKLTITPKQRDIYIDKITPKPLSMMVADEYGHYRVEGIMSSILAQFRSLNISAILSLQDVAGLGTDEDTQKTLANTSKFVLKSYDSKIKEFVEGQLSENEVIEQEKYIDSFGNVRQSVSENIKINKEKSIDASILSDLNYGCGLFISNSKPIIVQSYYFGGKEVEPYIASIERYQLS